MRCWPCGQNLDPSSNATYSAIRATMREAWVTGFDCGSAATAAGVTPPMR